MMMVPLVLMLVVLCLLFNVVVHANDSIVRDKDDESGGASTKASKAVKMFNFASQSAGAVILDKSPATAKGYHYLLNDDKDKYGISSCHEKKWVVIGLSEDILITSVEVSNYEKYSSMLKDFQLLASNSYPTDEWINLGTYTAKPQLGSQAFNVTSESHTRYLKVKFMTHYSDEALCTLSQIKVYGMTVIASFQQEVQRSDHHTRDMLNHLTAEEDVSFREIMENSLREEAIEAAHQEQKEPQVVEVPAEADAPAAEPAASSTEPAETVGADPLCPDASQEKTTDSCPSADVPPKEKGDSGVAEAVEKEKQAEEVCASGLTGEDEKKGLSVIDAAAAAPPSDTTSPATHHASANKTKDEGEDLVVTVSVGVDGGGTWEEPVPTEVEATADNTVEAEVPSSRVPLSAQTDKSADDVSIKNGDTTETIPPLDDQCTEQTAPSQTTGATPDPKTSDSAEEKVPTTSEVADNTCTNTETSEGATEDTADTSTDAAAVKTHPFVDVVVKKLMEFNLFVNPETPETATEDASGTAEQEEKQDLKNDTVVPAHASGNASLANTTHSAQANTTKPANGSSAAHAAHHEANSTHVVSNVSVFLSNATAAEKGHHKGGKETALLPHVDNATASDVAAHAAATHEKNATKASTTPHTTGEPAKATGEVVAVTHNTTASAHDAHKPDNKSHKPAEHNTTEPRPPATTSLPTTVSHNKTEHATAAPAPAPVKTANTTTVPTSSHHNTTSGNGTALNCFETLSFAKFSEKMRLKLQQKSAGGSANGSHSGDSAAAAEAAALAAAAGGSAKDNNVFRSLMQKIKTLEVDNAIVEMYTIQLSDCYKTVTKELMSRTQAAPSGDKKQKHSSAEGDIDLLWRLAPQVVFSYAESEKLGVVDTFLVLLYRVVEDNMVVLVIGAVASVCVLFIAVLVLTCVLLASKRARPVPVRDEH